MKKLIIDTDVALGVWHDGRPRDIDDGFAIVEAINSKDIDLLGVTCVFGNGPHEEVYRVANEIIDLKQSNTPVLPGAKEPMKICSESNPAVEFLADSLRKQKLNIAAIGPLTNIGLLIKHHPEVIHNIDQLIMVAGRTPGNDFYIGDAGPVQDFNFENDVAAMQLIMEAGIACVLMGFELTSQVVITKQDLDVIAQRKNSTAQYFYTNSVAWAEYWTRTFPVDAGFHPWDSAAIAWLIKSSWFSHELRGYSITADPPSLDCSTRIQGPMHIYCHGFEPGGAHAFVQQVIREVY